ncbi:MAG: VWA domain-containing protein [Alphaproteobacteria bacterium]|nr:VWA domain-containing protein [Alphaproteobacteria bacterium]
MAEKRNKFLKYLSHCAGGVAVAFGLTVPVVVASVGVSVDMAQSYLVKSRLSGALDAAALAAAASASEDEGEIEDVVERFLEANYPDGRIGETTSIEVSLDGGELTVEASAKLDTSFMKLFGYPTVDVETYTVVQREVRGLEVVMVLDNTGSMTTNNNIGALQEAAESFVEILFDRASDPDGIKIGMVPYSSSVNVGPYGLGIDIDEDDYGEPFVQAPDVDIYDDYVSGQSPYSTGQYGIDEDDLEYDPSEEGQWHGCVLAEDYSLDVEDHDGPWEMYRYDYNGSTNSWYDNVYRWSPYTTYGDYYNHYYGPNIYCPRQPIVPLSSDEDFLYDAIDNMNASGNTLGNIGLVWGWRVISPEEPFIEGAAYDDNEWDKAILMMTDGVNTMSSVYSAYGRSDDHSVDADDLNDRMAEICEAIKAEGVLVYTVTFDSGVDDETKEFYEDCATTTAQYYDAPSQDDLIEVFEQISRELSNLYVKE